MAEANRSGDRIPSRWTSPILATTHWSVVLAAGEATSPESSAALSKLCETYWRPLYAFVRRQGQSPEDAEDLTQEFFARLLEKEFIAMADPARGRFRSFLLASLKNFIMEQHRHASRLKRGGGRVILSLDAETAEERYLAAPTEESTPETIYEKRWAVTLLEQALSRLEAELAAAGKERLFAELKSHLWGEKGGSSYAEIASRFEMSEGAIKVAVHRLRERYRELLREEVAQTLANRDDIDDELTHLMAIVRG